SRRRAAFSPHRGPSEDARPISGTRDDSRWASGSQGEEPSQPASRSPSSKPRSNAARGPRVWDVAAAGARPGSQ
ncbi:unnamed protein product, partial [Rangifer tarandus platyrhynchus]